VLNTISRWCSRHSWWLVAIGLIASSLVLVGSLFAITGEEPANANALYFILATTKGAESGHTVFYRVNNDPFGVNDHIVYDMYVSVSKFNAAQTAATIITSEARSCTAEPAQDGAVEAKPFLTVLPEPHDSRLSLIHLTADSQWLQAHLRCELKMSPIHSSYTTRKLRFSSESHSSIAFSVGNLSVVPVEAISFRDAAPLVRELHFRFGIEESEDKSIADQVNAALPANSRDAQLDDSPRTRAVATDFPRIQLGPAARLFATDVEWTDLRAEQRAGFLNFFLGSILGLGFAAFLEAIRPIIAPRDLQD